MKRMTKSRIGILLLQIIMLVIFCFAIPHTVCAEEASGKSADLSDDAGKTFNEKVYDFIDSITTLDEDIKGLDLSVVKIALYKPGLKHGEVDIPANVASIIESKLKNKFLSTRRLQVYECLECKVVHVSMEKDKFVMSKVIESNDRLKEVGKKIGVNGFLIWSLYTDDKNIYLDLNIVNATNGMVVWTKQYVRNPSTTKKLDSEYAVDLSVGFLGYNVVRKNTAGDPAKVDKVIVENIALTKKTAFSDVVSVGLGFTHFHNITDTDLIDTSGFYVYPLIEIQMGPYYGKKLSLFNFYVGAGEAFFSTFESPVLLSGLNIRLRPELFVGVGFVNINSKTVKQPNVSTGAYEPTINFGGNTYEVKFGYRF